MRIGFVVVKNILVGGGIESYTYEVGRRLAKRGHEVTIFTMAHYGASPGCIEGIRVVRVKSWRGVATERVTASISALLTAVQLRPRFDVLHFHTPMTGFLVKLAEWAGYPTIVQMHGIEWQRSRWGPVARNTIKVMERVVMSTAPVCITVSQVQADFYQGRYGRKVFHIPPGTTDTLPVLEHNELDTIGVEPGRFILFASRLVSEKGAHYLLEAFRRMSTNFKLVLAGGELDKSEYHARLRCLIGDDSRIIVPGFVQGDLKQQLLSHAAVYVLPSEMEGLSIALLDAMAYGRPCLASDISENLEAFGDAGHTFQNRDSHDLERQLSRLLSDPAYREELGRAARARVKNFSWDHVTDSLESLYRKQLYISNVNPTRGVSHLGLDPVLSSSTGQMHKSVCERALSHPATCALGETELVSVVIPTRGRPKLVVRAVESALAQSYPHLEVVVIVDGEDAETRCALTSSKDSRLRVVGLDLSVGGAEARNLGVQQARGRWVAFLDDDDDWMPGKIASQVAAARGLSNPNTFLSCRFMMKSDSGVEVHPLRLPDPFERIDEYIFSPKGFRTGEGFLQTSTLFAPRALLLQVPFAKGLRRGQESAWMLRACTYGKAEFYVVPEVLSNFNNDSFSDNQRVSARPQWRSFYEWSLANQECFTPKTFACCIATSILPDAIKAQEPVRTKLRVFLDCFLKGRPTAKCALKAAYVILLPSGARRRIIRRRALQASVRA